MGEKDFVIVRNNEIRLTRLNIKPLLEAVNILRICEWCQLAYYAGHGNQKYCGDECARNAERENSRLRMHKHRKKYKENGKLGSGGLGPHAYINDFDKELRKIQREKRWLGLI